MKRMALLSASILLLVPLLMVTQQSFAQSAIEVPDTIIEPTWNDANNGSQAQFKVTFAEPGTTIPRSHVDYDLVIMKDGERVFSAAQNTNQPLIHTNTGLVTVPYTFAENGEYTVEVTIYAVDLPPTPVSPVTTTMPIQVTPEFPMGIAAIATMGMITAAVLITRVARGKRLF